MLRFIVPTSWVVAKTLLAAGGMAAGVVAEVFEMQDGIQAIDVLLGLQVLVLGAIWQLGREVSKLHGLRADVNENKAAIEELRRPRLIQ